MLSPHFPPWLLPTISPLFTFIGRAVPSAWKGTLLLVLAFVVTIGVVIVTPLDWPELTTQALILFGLVTAGYTLAKPIETTGPRGVAIGACVVIGCMGLGSWALAQPGISSTAQPGILPTTPLPPVAETANFWLQVAMSFLNGILGRLVKRIPI